MYVTSEKIIILKDGHGITSAIRSRDALHTRYVRNHIESINFGGVPVFKIEGMGLWVG